MMYACVWHDSSACATWLIQIDTRSYVWWQDPYRCVTWRFHMCDMTYLHVGHDSCKQIYHSGSCKQKRVVMSVCVLQCVAVICCSWKRKRAVMNVCVLQRVAVICCGVLYSCVIRGNRRGLWWMCVCCGVLQSYVAVCCSHVLFVEAEEGRDECVCVAACCSHMLQRVAVICYSWKWKRAVMNVCVLQCVVVICVAAWVAVCCRYMHCSVCYGVLQSYVLQFVLQCAAVICAAVCVAACCSHMCCSVCCSLLQWCVL